MSLTLLRFATICWLSFKYTLVATFTAAALFLFYHRVYWYWVLRAYYERQGVKVVDQTYPLLGSLFPIIKRTMAATDSADNVYIVAKISKDELGTSSRRTLLVFGPNEPYVHISDPKIV